MRLKIDTKPRLYTLEFYTKEENYTSAQSPRSLVHKRGLEFDHFREYQTGDDARMIDWVASARTDKPLVRVHTEDIALNILVVLDISESMIYGTTEKAKIEFAIELTLNLIFGMLNFGDKVGLVTFSDGIKDYIPFRSGIENYGVYMETLTEESKMGGAKDLSTTIAFIIEQCKDTHLMLFISDFLGMRESLMQDIHSIADAFDFLGLQVLDRSDIELNRSLSIMNVKDPFSQGMKHVNVRGIEKKYRMEVQNYMAQLENFFKTMEKDMWFFTTEDDIESKVPELLTKRNTGF